MAGQNTRRLKPEEEEILRKREELASVAEDGQPDAQYQLGLLYYRDSTVVPQDYTEAVKWWRKAAEQGDISAQHALGHVYYNGRGVEENYAEAVRWYRKAAELGNVTAQCDLGYCYYYGQGVHRNYVEAVKWFRKCTPSEFGLAELALGYCYYYGRGVPQDYGESARWFCEALESNSGESNTQADCMLGFIYSLGHGVKQDYAEALKRWRGSADHGYPPAQQALGAAYRDGKGVTQDSMKAVKWFRKAAYGGNALAQFNLGMMHEWGQGVLKDSTEAVKWWRRAAEQGYPKAQSWVGYALWIGKGVLLAGQDEGVAHYAEEAVKWWRKAAEQGDAYSQNALGNAYHNGRGVEQNHAEAAHWYRQAAEQGYAIAQFNLGQRYYYGQGVHRDYVLAYKWYVLAAAHGSREEQTARATLRDDVARKLTSQQLAGAQRLAQEWKPLEEMPSKFEQTDLPEGSTWQDRELREVLPAPQVATSASGLSQVVGMANLKEQLIHDVIGPSKNPELYRRYRVSLPNGILFYGPPGCGKTYIARSLAAELGWSFRYCRPSDVASPYIHETVSKIHSVFATAIEKAPSIVFIDEFEAFVPARSELGGHQQYKAEEVNEFLANLEGCAERKVLVIAATNEPDKIDPAVRRSGRFDKLILIPPPDAEARQAMLEFHLNDRPVEASLDTPGIAAVLEGYSASDIKLLVEEAARMALKRQGLIATRTLLAALERVPASITADDMQRYELFRSRSTA